MRVFRIIIGTYQPAILDTLLRSHPGVGKKRLQLTLYQIALIWELCFGTNSGKPNPLLYSVGLEVCGVHSRNFK